MAGKIFSMDHLDKVAVILMRDACGNPAACRLIEKLAQAQGVSPRCSVIADRLEFLKNSTVFGQEIITLGEKASGKRYFFISSEDGIYHELTPSFVKGWPVAKAAQVQEACIKLLIKVAPQDIEMVEWF